MLVIVQLFLMEMAKAAPRRESEYNKKLAELIEEKLSANELEIELEEVTEVRAEAYDAATDTETTIVVFPIEVDHSTVGHIFTDHAANEMIARLDGDIKVFEEMKNKIHFLEEHMKKHKNVHLVDDKPIEDAQTILEVMDKTMLIPFRANLESIKEEIINMDHSLKGETLDYVKGLTERAETFIKEAHEKLDIVVEADEEWTKTEEEVINTSEESSPAKENPISDAEEISNDLINQESFEKDAASKYKKWKNIRKGGKFNNQYSTNPSNDIKGDTLDLDFNKEDSVPMNQELDEDLKTTEQASGSEDNELLKEVKEDGGEEEVRNIDDVAEEVKEDVKEEVDDKIAEGSETKEVDETPEEEAVDIKKKINSNVKLLLEKTNFWKINEKLTPHKHEHDSGSWAMVIGLPFIILVPLLAILGGLYAFCKLGSKDIISVQRNNYPCHLEKVNVSTLETFPKMANYNKLK